MLVNSTTNDREQIFNDKKNPLTKTKADLFGKPKIIGPWRANTLGTPFENSVLKELQKEFTDVKSNIFFDLSGKRIEVDHVVKDRMIISCNDRSTIKTKWKIDLAIAEDLNLIEFRKELLQYKFARIYFKIHPKLKPQIIPQFHNFTTDTNVKVIIV